MHVSILPTWAGTFSTTDLQCIQCHVNYMTLDQSWSLKLVIFGVLYSWFSIQRQPSNKINNLTTETLDTLKMPFPINYPRPPINEWVKCEIWVWPTLSLGTVALSASTSLKGGHRWRRVQSVAPPRWPRSAPPRSWARRWARGRRTCPLLPGCLRVVKLAVVVSGDCSIKLNLMLVAREICI